MKKGYVIFFISSYIIISLSGRFSLIVAYLLYFGAAIFVAIPFYKFIKEKQKDEIREIEEKKKTNNTLKKTGNILTFLGILLLSFYVLKYAFSIITFILMFIITIVKSNISN